MRTRQEIAGKRLIQEPSCILSFPDRGLRVPYRKFDKYGIVKRLATGGISEIFLAREDQGRGLLDRHVVIKKLMPQFAGNERLAAIIQREARLLAALYHANIVQVYDAGITEDGEPYLVLEYIQGQDLRAIFQVVREGKTPLAPSMIYYILEQVLRALVHMHELKDPKGRPYQLVHRDLSPTNIMCSMSGDVKLLDFGLARRALDVTGSGSLTGKLPYLSPEQLQGGRVDSRSDLFALGTVFYELCTGRFRYDGENDAEIIAAIRERREIPLMKAARHHPPELLAVIAKACEYDPSRRPAAARHMLEELSSLPSVVPGLHGGRAELVDFMEFHFGATRIDSTLPVETTSEKPLEVRSFNIASMDLPNAEDVQGDSVLQETLPMAGKPRPQPPPGDWFEPLSADPQPPGMPSAPLKPAPAPNEVQEEPDFTRQGWKMPPAPAIPSAAASDTDITSQGWKIPPVSAAPPNPAPPPDPGQPPAHRNPGTPLPPPGNFAPPAPRPPGTPLPPPHGPAPAESTVPVPPLAFDMFNDETRYLPDEAPARPPRGDWFSHTALRIVFPAAGIVLLLVTAWLLLRPSSHNPKDILITLESDSHRATAYLDEAPLGLLPVTFAFPRDGKSHEIRVEAPRKIPWRKTLQPATVQPGTLRVEMQPMLAEIKLFSTTSGVEVRILNEKLNVAEDWLPLPLLLSDLEPGSVLKLEARMKRKKWETQIQVPEKSYQEIAVEPPSGR